MLGKYGTIYKNYLKEYKKRMYNNLKSKGKLEQHCYQRELELKELREFIKEISNQKGNIDVEMINKDVTKVLPMYMDEKIYSKLQNMVGKETVILKDK